MNHPILTSEDIGPTQISAVQVSIDFTHYHKVKKFQWVVFDQAILLSAVYQACFFYSYFKHQLHIDFYARTLVKTIFEN